MLLQANLSSNFFELAFVCANFIYNRCINTRNLEEIPFEILHGLEPRVDYFRVFDCKAF